MKSFLLLGCAALLMSSCAKENVEPQAEANQLSTVTSKKKVAEQLATTHDYQSDPRGTGLRLGAADANNIAAGYSSGNQGGGSSSTGGTYPSTNPAPGTPGGPYGGPVTGTQIDPNDNGYGIGGGVDYGPGFAPQHSYSIPPSSQAAFERDIAALRANAEAHQAAATDANEQMYWQGYIQGVDDFLFY